MARLQNRAKQNPKLRQLELKDGRASLFLEYYLGRTETPVLDEQGNQVVYESGAMKGKPKFHVKHTRKSESLNLYIWLHPRNQQERLQNKNTLALAEKIRFEREQQFLEDREGYRLKKEKEKFADTQEHFISLLAFCSCEMKQILDKVPVMEANSLKMEDYQPCCTTPLYDAMGFTITKMRDYVRSIENAVVVVTIITDGLENASKEYTSSSIKSLVESLREEGWTFTYMGANQDAVEVAMNLSIRNSRNFEYSEQGVEYCMVRDTNTRMKYYSKLHSCAANPKEKLSKRIMSKLADKAFDEEENESKE